MSDTPVRLFDDFPRPSYDEWRAAAEQTLKGAAFEKKLITHTYEGIDLHPLYRQDDAEKLAHINSLPGFAPYVRGSSASGYLIAPWDICQELAADSPEGFNRALRADLERGQNAINMALSAATRMGQVSTTPTASTDAGLALACHDDMQRALADINLAALPLLLQSGAATLPLAALLLALLRARGNDPTTLNGCLGGDPLGTLAQQGTLPAPLDTLYDDLAALIAWASNHAPSLQTLLVQGTPYHDSGASATQELAFALASATAYLRALLARGIAIDTAARTMRFAFSIGSNFFMEIARLRAARLLWARIVAAFGGSNDAQRMTIHARTSRWNKTRYDPYVNMLRTTAEAFAGVLGGCTSLHVGAFDEVARTPDDFSRRIARNTQIILQQESHLDRAIDPAGGSWYVETLTDQVARAAWRLFQQVEQRGGMLAALQEGFPQAEVARVAAERARNIAHRRDIVVGTNMYPNSSEEPLAPRATETNTPPPPATMSSNAGTATLREARASNASGPQVVEAAIAAAASGAHLDALAGTLWGTGDNVPQVEPLRIHRGAEPFEQLRANAEAWAAAHGGQRPQVFLANMGPIPQHKPRADFSSGFFLVGGFDVLNTSGFATPEDAAQAALDSGAPIVVVCSTDDTYPHLVPPLAAQIKQARPDTLLVLAGYPKEHVEALQQAGIDEFIHMRANCYEVLARFQQQIGVSHDA